MDDLTILYYKNGIAISEDSLGKNYITNDNNLSVVMLAREDESFIFIKQYRRAVNDHVIQLPGGGVEEGEDLEAAVRREFYEETGFKCGEVQYLGYLVPASWISNEITHVFYTEEVGSRSQQSLEEYEKIEVIHITVRETLKLISDSQINDSELTFAILQGILKGLIRESCMG